MNSLARKIDDALDILVPGRRLPDPANDNRHHADFGRYVDDVRAHAGAQYQRADAKLWWVP